MPLPISIQSILDDPQFKSDVQLLGGSLSGGTAEKNAAARRVEEARNRITGEINKMGIQSPFSPELLSGALMGFGSGQFLSADEFSGNFPQFGGRESFANLFGSPKAAAEFTLGGGQFENLNIPRTQLSTGGFGGGQTFSVPKGSTFQVNPQGIILKRGDQPALTAEQFGAFQAQNDPMAQGLGGQAGAVPGQPQGPQQATVLTPAQSTNANNTLYKQWNGSNWDVFNADGTPMKDIKRFESGELNIDHINTKQVLASRTPGVVESEETFDAGASSTGRLGGEQDDFFRDEESKQEESEVRKAVSPIQKAILDAIAIITAPPSEEKTQLQEQLFGIQKEEAERTVGLGQEVIPQELIDRQITSLRRDAAIIMQPIVDRLDTLAREEGNVQQKAKLLLQLQQATMPETNRIDIADDGTITAIKTDPTTGRSFTETVGTVPREIAQEAPEFITKSTRVASNGALVFHGLTESGEVITSQLSPPGEFEPTEISGEDDIDSLARRVNAGQMNLSSVPSSIRGRVSTKAKEFATDELREEITIGDTQGLTREQIIESLAPAYPEFSRSEIRNEVFNTIPDKPEETKEPEEQGTLGGFFSRLFSF